MNTNQDNSSKSTPSRLRQLIHLGSMPGSPTLSAVVAQLAAFVISVVVFLAIITVLGYDPSQVLNILWSGSLGSDTSISITLNETVPLILTATAVWLVLQGGLFNIGADGQLQMGGLIALMVAFWVPLESTPVLLVLLALLAAALIGALWASIAAALKVFRGANEIISTLMLNFIAFLVVDRTMRGPLQSPTHEYSPRTEAIPDAAKLGDGIAGTLISPGIVVAVAVCIVTLAVVRNTNIGLRLRAIGLNRDASVRGGVAVTRYWLSSFAVGGAICGLAGGIVILGLRYFIAPGWAAPWGFAGILIAFLVLRTPYLIPAWGLVFGMLSASGPALKASAGVPESIVIMMQTIPVIVLYGVLLAARRFAKARWSSAQGEQA